MLGRLWKAIARTLLGGKPSTYDPSHIGPIQFDLDAWEQVTGDDGEIAFAREPGDVLTMHSFDRPPDIPCALNQLTELRDFYRDMLTEAGGGIVSLTTVNIGGIEAVEALFKFSQESSGMYYLASITIPFRDCSYVFKVQCPEYGITGMRDAAVVASLGDADFESEDWQKSWAHDPYDPSHQGAVLRNQSDDEEWDATFPDHPVSRARRYLQEFRKTLVISPELKAAAPFTGA